MATTPADPTTPGHFSLPYIYPLGFPYSQTDSTGKALSPFAHIYDQIANAKVLPSLYASSPVAGMGMGRYAFASGAPNPLNAGRNAPWTNTGQADAGLFTWPGANHGDGGGRNIPGRTTTGLLGGGPAPAGSASGGGLLGGSPTGGTPAGGNVNTGLTPGTFTDANGITWNRTVLPNGTVVTERAGGAAPSGTPTPSGGPPVPPATNSGPSPATFAPAPPPTTLPPPTTAPPTSAPPGPVDLPPSAGGLLGSSPVPPPTQAPTPMPAEQPTQLGFANFDPSGPPQGMDFGTWVSQLSPQQWQQYIGGQSGQYAGGG